MPRIPLKLPHIALAGCIGLLILAFAIRTILAPSDLDWIALERPETPVLDASLQRGQLALLTGGQLIRGETPVQTELHHAERIAWDQSTGACYWSEANGQLFRLGDNGELKREQLEGDSVIAMAAHPSGTIGILHAPSYLSPAPLISGFQGESLFERWRLHLPFAATHLLTHPQGWVFAQANGRVGLLDLDGNLRWEAHLDQMPIALCVDLAGRVLVGDRRGGLVQLDESGTNLWKRTVSPYPVTQIGWTTHQGLILYAAMDNQNHLSLIDGRGRPRGRWFTGLEAPVLLLAEPQPGQLLILSRLGEIRSADLPEFLYSPWHPIWKTTLTLVSIALFTAVATLLLLQIRSARRRLIDSARSAWRSRGCYAFLLPAFLFLSLFCYLPALSGLGIAFTDYSLTRPMKFAGLRNFAQLAGDPYFRIGITNLSILIVAGLIKAFTLPLLAAELIFWLSGERLRRWLRTAFILPAMVPLVVTLLVWKLIYNPSYGFLNQVLAAVGLEGFQAAWLAEESTALGAIIFFGFPWISIVPFLLFFGGLITIPGDVLEAAQMDGARPWRRFQHVDLPLLVPQFKLIAILVFIDTVQNFAVVLLLTGGGPGFTTYVPPLQMFYETVEAGNLGYASAIGVTLFLLVLAASWLIHKIPEPGR